MSETSSPIMQQSNAKGTTAIQAQFVNINNGITEERCREICMDMYKNNILSLQNEAKDIAYQRAEHLTDLFIEKLSKQDFEIRKKIEECLKEPAMQEAIFKSQKCYALSNDENHLSILTNMLIEKASTSLRTNKQMLIDDAIDMMPRINQEHLNILSIYTDFMTFNNDTSIDNLRKYILALIKGFNSIPKGNLLQCCCDYLSSKNCIYNTRNINMLHPIEKILSNHFPCLNVGFRVEDFLSEIKEQEFLKFIGNSIISPGNVVVNIINVEIEKFLNTITNDNTAKDKMRKFLNKTHSTETTVIRKYLIKEFPDIKIIFDTWDIISQYHMTPLGIIIGLKYNELKTNTSINWDFE